MLLDKLWILVVTVLAVIIVGCMALDATQSQSQSSNMIKGELEVIPIVPTGADWLTVEPVMSIEETPPAGTQVTSRPPATAVETGVGELPISFEMWAWPLTVEQVQACVDTACNVNQACHKIFLCDVNLPDSGAIDGAWLFPFTLDRAQQCIETACTANPSCTRPNVNFCQ